MQFMRLLSIFATIAVAGVSASPIASEGEISARTNRVYSPATTTEHSCNVGTAQCCQTIYQSNDRSFLSMLSLIGTAIPADGLLAGIQCSPILGTAGLLSGSSSCNSQPVCCTGNTFKGLINIGCSPISL